MENRDYESFRQRRIEYIVMFVYTIYAVSTCIIEYKTEAWWVSILIQAFLVIMWMCFLTRLKSFAFRANIAALLLEISITLYALNTERYLDILPSCIGLIIILGLYEMPKLMWLPFISTTIAMAYHLFVTHSIQFTDTITTIKSLLEILSAYTSILIVHFLVTEEQRAKVRLMGTIDELQDIQRSKDDFLANVSHELRTPINTICGMSEIILRDQELKPDLSENLRSIQNDGKNLLSVVSDILDFSELQTGKMELVKEPYNITSVINDVINMSLAKMKGKNIDILVDCDINIPSGLRGDEQKIRRVFMSLIDNAIKFTHEGFFKIKISCRKEEYGVNLIVTVKDTGIGMKPESLGRIFAGFTQVNSRRNREENGIGLGLSIAQAIVELMGGFITVNSAYGKGTEVQFTIPQEVTDETPIAKVEDPDRLLFYTYMNSDRLGMGDEREECRNILIKIAEQTKVKTYMCMSLKDLKRRLDIRKCTHLFIGMEEYREDPAYFDELSDKVNVAVFISPGDESEMNSDRIIKLPRPLFSIPVVNVANGYSKPGLNDEKDSPHGRFVAGEAHILAVDDSFMNIRVLEGLLKAYKVKLTTASSGKEAIEKVQSKDYDFVFMDHMMPEMDGIECMHRIKDMDDIFYKNLPIVALTANAVAGMREMFLSEGFDDFLAKPVELSGLERILKKFIPDNKIKYLDEMEIKEEEEKASEEKNLTIGDLDVEKGLVYCGSYENYVDILRMHAEGGEDNKKNIIGFFNEKDWENYTILVHALKSSMLSIGAVNLSDKAKALETAGKNNKIDYILENHEEMIKEYERVIDLIKNSSVLGEGRADEEDISDLRELADEEMDTLIAAFEDAVYTFEPDDMLAVLDGIEDCSYKGHPLKKELASIRRKIDMSDYMSASAAFAAIKEKS